MSGPGEELKPHLPSRSVGLHSLRTTRAPDQPGGEPSSSRPAPWVAGKHLKGDALNMSVPAIPLIPKGRSVHRCVTNGQVTSSRVSMPWLIDPGGDADTSVCGVCSVPL